MQHRSIELVTEQQARLLKAAVRGVVKHVLSSVPLLVSSHVMQRALQQCSQVDGDVDALAGGARLQGVDLRGDQPPQGPPRPGERRDEDADEHDDSDGDVIRQLGRLREVVPCGVRYVGCFSMRS